jgi:hypothetical protein
MFDTMKVAIREIVSNVTNCSLAQMDAYDRQMALQIGEPYAQALNIAV